MPSWWKFYLAYAGFRYATIVLGILYRYQNNQANDPSFAIKAKNLPELLVNTSLKIIKDVSFAENTTNIKKLGI